MSPVKIIRHIV